MRIFGIASQDERDRVVRFVAQMGLTFPVLYDHGTEVLNRYGSLPQAFDTIYPQDWIVGIDGRVAYVNPGYDPEAMAAVLDAELAR